MQDLSNSVMNGYLRMCDPIQKVKGSRADQVSECTFLLATYVLAGSLWYRCAVHYSSVCLLDRSGSLTSLF